MRALEEEVIHVKEWPERGATGGKRANVTMDLAYYARDCRGELEYVPNTGTTDWFEGFGKSEDCRFEGTWWDMICFARNVLASENTKLVAPEFYHPEMANQNYTGPRPYTYGEEKPSGS